MLLVVAPGLTLELAGCQILLVATRLVVEAEEQRCAQEQEACSA